MKAISPLIVFLILYLATSIIVQDFYKVPIAVAFLVSACYALLTVKGTMSERISIFARGAGNPTMVLMLAIFILAGAFAASAKTTGAVDATVNLALKYLPEQAILPGIFLASCFISLSIGTSCGTIAALTPLAVGIAQQAGVSVPLMVGLVVGGTYFGDNLSFISDTTIVATQTQGCSMRDKFRVNIRIIAPVAIIMFVVYFFLGNQVSTPAEVGEVNFWLVLPYLAVIIFAVCGLNVLLTLGIGILLTGIIGMVMGTYDLFGWFAAMNEGMMGMSELIIVTILAGGMLEIIRYNGGIDLIIKTLTRNINSKRGGEMSIAALTCLVNICTANNTVAILTAGPIAKDIAQRFKIDPRKSASILDTASCFTQGLLPYGAQVLIAAGLSETNPITIIPYLYYPMLIALALLLAILFQYPRKYAKLLVVFLPLMALTACEKETTYRTYENGRLPYILEVPDTWEMDESDPVFIKFTNPERTLSISCEIGEHTLIPDKYFDAFYDFLYQEHEADIYNKALIQKTDSFYVMNWKENDTTFVFDGSKPMNGYLCGILVTAHTTSLEEGQIIFQHVFKSIKPNPNFIFFTDNSDFVN